MIEKLLENWLDNASERSYQQVFVQMLTARGHSVVHSTRHCLLEFGKDILAIAPDGTGCAFQLKGDPKGQMTIGEFRSGIQQQAAQLMMQAPPFPGFPKGIHRSFLVSNGQFSEEVQVAVEQMNAMPSYPSKLELWSRGTLLDMALDVSKSLWPSEIGDTRRLLDLYMADPKDELLVDVMHQLQSSILRLGADDDVVTDAGFRRTTSSVMWATSIALDGYARVGNHYALICGWTMCRFAIHHAAERHGFKDQRLLQDSAALLDEAIIDSLAGLWEEVHASNHLVCSPALEDSEIYTWRMITLSGLLSVLYVRDKWSACLTIEAREALKAWLVQPRVLELWGEAAVAPVFSLAVVHGMLGDSNKMRTIIVDMAESIIGSNVEDSAVAYLSPYYTGNDAFSMLLSLDEPPPNPETFAGASYLARPLFLCMAALGMKEDCQRLWPKFSKLVHRYTEFEADSDYLSFMSRKGMEVSRLYPEASTWDALVGEVNVERKLMVDPLWLQMLWWQVAPHRANAHTMLAAISS